MLNEKGKALMAAIQANSIFDLNLSARTDTRTTEENNQEIDALPTPPDWFQAGIITDLSQLRRAYTDLSEKEIEAIGALELARHRKRDYQQQLKRAGSPEELKAHQEAVKNQWQIENAAWRAHNGYPVQE